VPVSIALYAYSLVGLTRDAFVSLAADGRLRDAADWATRQARTLARHYCNEGRKVQVVHWNRARQYALWLAGWEVYGRPVGNRTQLVFAPRTFQAGESLPTELVAG
jgi:hypothetical protein